jgi:hypothetical protein
MKSSEYLRTHKRADRDLDRRQQPPRAEQAHARRDGAAAQPARARLIATSVSAPLRAVLPARHPVALTQTAPEDQALANALHAIAERGLRV